MQAAPVEDESDGEDLTPVDHDEQEEQVADSGAGPGEGEAQGEPGQIDAEAAEVGR